MPQPEQPHTILLVHCHYRLPGGEDAVFAAECAMLQAHGHRVITYERNNDAGGLAQKLLLPLRAIYSTKTVREVRALIRKEQVDLVHVHNTLLTISPSVFQACFKEHVPAVQTLHNFRIFCPNGILMRDGHVCEECPQHGLGCAVRHSCYRGSRAQSLVCAGIYAFHRLLGTYRKVNLITLTEFDRSKLLEFNCKASRPVFTPERLYCKPNGVAAPNHSPLPWAQRKTRLFCWAAGRIKGAAHRHRGLAAAGAGRTAADRGRYRPAGSLGQRERPRYCNLYRPAPAWNTYRAFGPEPRRPLPQPVL